MSLIKIRRHRITAVSPDNSRDGGRKDNLFYGVSLRARLQHIMSCPNLHLCHEFLHQTCRNINDVHDAQLSNIAQVPLFSCI